MTPLEERLSTVTWARYLQDWTTVQDGVGFSLFRQGTKMWLCGYHPKTVEERQDIHRDVAPYITIYRNPSDKSMFMIPASNEFVSAVILNHFPELT